MLIWYQVGLAVVLLLSGLIWLLKTDSGYDLQCSPWFWPVSLAFVLFAVAVGVVVPPAWASNEAAIRARRYQRAERDALMIENQSWKVWTLDHFDLATPDKSTGLHWGIRIELLAHKTGDERAEKTVRYTYITFYIKPSDPDYFKWEAVHLHQLVKVRHDDPHLRLFLRLNGY